LTDGHTYGDEENCIELVNKAVEKNIKINALGFGNEWNDKFLDEITGITGGCAYYVKTLFDLPKFLQITLTSLSTTVAHNTNLEIQKNDDVQLKYIFRIEPEISQLQLKDPVQMGNLIKEKKSSYFFAFELSSSVKKLTEIDLITGKVRFVLSDIHNRYAEQDIAIRLKVSDKPSEISIPLEIVQAMARVNLFLMQEKSKQDVDNGNVNNAVRRLTYLATHLIGQGNVPFAKEVLNEAESIKKGQAYSEDGIKRLKYGTRALLQLPEPEKRK
jgi:Ca-activated chloride channel family protein